MKLVFLDASVPVQDVLQPAGFEGEIHRESIFHEPSDIEIRPLSPVVSGLKGGLLCLTSGFDPWNLSVFWFHKGFPVPPSNITSHIIRERDGTFSLRSLYRFIPTEADCTAECLCQVSNPAWQLPRNASITLIIHYGPRTVTVTSDSGAVINGPVHLNKGSPLNLSCASEGKPWPETQWLRGDITVQHSTETLHIPAVQKEHEGLYWCVARNQYGERNSSITLLVSDSGCEPTCLLVKLLCVGILVLVDTIIFIVFLIRKNKTADHEAIELSMSQTSPQ
ncbi:hypothetical protein MATL_G00192660 [Megalops atlanticus]|uniref:Ig-like domain-containing protein n=1 Tax=Megalops atlanticus TaxID=7932 RepID=A0A9D3T5D4_MEGAT|nr:hypothetical protein MATL_G00192660 [Megalops atlanticus]